MSISNRAFPGLPLGDRSVIVTKRGVPWWVSVLGAFAVTGVGVAVDLALGDGLSWVFLVFYVVGCVGAVLAVAHRGLFAAMVQPPLILAVAVPVVVQAMGTPTGGGGLRDQVVTMALPLINGFPAMALTTLATLALGGARIAFQRRSYPADTPERIAAAREAYRPRSGTHPRRRRVQDRSAATSRLTRVAGPVTAPGAAPTHVTRQTPAPRRRS